MEKQLYVGRGKAEVRLTEECFPADGFTGVHDPLYVRVIVLEQGGERYGIMSAELTSMLPGTVAEYKQMLRKIAGVEQQNSWIAATHTFSAPHLREVPVHSGPDAVRPGASGRDIRVNRALAEGTETEEDRRSTRVNSAFAEAAERAATEEDRRDIRVNSAFAEAAERAAREAAASMRPALCGAGEGVCLVNANRNMETREGWWLGCDAELFSDHTVPVLKFESPDGAPLALLYAYDCQSSVMDMSRLADGSRLVSGDLLGSASAYVEKEYGEGFVALGLCGAAGDQEPQLKAKRNEIDRNGSLRTVDLGEAGFALLDAQGSRLGAELLKAAARICCAEASVRAGRRDFLCGAKVMERNREKLHPTRSHAYVPDGTRLAEVQAFAFGGFAIVGTRAELAGKTASQLRSVSPFAHTAVATMVDGGAKYMVDAEAYDRITYGAMNSPFWKGSAEKLVEEGLLLLQELCNGSAS